MKKSQDQQNDKPTGWEWGVCEAVMINPQRQIPYSYRHRNEQRKECGREGSARNACPFLNGCLK